MQAGHAYKIYSYIKPFTITRYTCVPYKASGAYQVIYNTTIVI